MKYNIIDTSRLIGLSDIVIPKYIEFWDYNGVNQTYEGLDNNQIYTQNDWNYTLLNKLHYIRSLIVSEVNPDNTRIRLKFSFKIRDFVEKLPFYKNGKLAFYEIEYVDSLEVNHVLMHEVDGSLGLIVIQNLGSSR